MEDAIGATRLCDEVCAEQLPNCFACSGAAKRLGQELYTREASSRGVVPGARAALRSGAAPPHPWTLQLGREADHQRTAGRGEIVNIRLLGGQRSSSADGKSRAPATVGPVANFTQIQDLGTLLAHSASET